MKGRATDYIKQGGGMDTLTRQGAAVDALPSEASFGAVEGGRGLRDAMKGAISVFGKIGQTSEMAMRLALRERAMKNGATPEEATWIARNYIDFAKGGAATKYADQAVPYLNAAVQGTRGTLRAFKTDPKTASFKAAQLITLGFLHEMFTSMMNQEAHESNEFRSGSSTC